MTTFDYGRESLRQYIIAVRPARFDWPPEYDNDIEYARQRFNAGTHIMCQGRDGDTIIQYLIPRQRPAKPCHFFEKSWFDIQREKWERLPV